MMRAPGSSNSGFNVVPDITVSMETRVGQVPKLACEVRVILESASQSKKIIKIKPGRQAVLFARQKIEDTLALAVETINPAHRATRKQTERSCANTHSFEIADQGAFRLPALLATRIGFPVPQSRLKRRRCDEQCVVNF